MRTGIFGSEVENRTGLFLDGVRGSGGFRRVGSGVRIRRLLTRASGTLLAPGLGRNKILGFGRGHDDMVSHGGPFLGHFCLNYGALLVGLWSLLGQIVGRFFFNCGAVFCQIVERFWSNCRAPICALKIFQILHRFECSK